MHLHYAFAVSQVVSCNVIKPLNLVATFCIKNNAPKHVFLRAAIQSNLKHGYHIHTDLQTVDMYLRYICIDII